MKPAIFLMSLMFGTQAFSGTGDIGSVGKGSYRVQCIKAMATEEAGVVGQTELAIIQKYRLNGKTVIPLYFTGESLEKSKYEWDYRKRVVVTRTSSGKTETVWDPRLVNENEDGRTKVASLKNSKISDSELKKIQDWYLMNSAISKHIWNAYNKFGQNQQYVQGQLRLYDKIFAECEGVTDVQINREKKVSVGDAAVKARYNMREKYPELFKSSTSSRSGSGTR